MPEVPGATPVARMSDYCRRCNKLCRDNPHFRFYCPGCHEVTCGMKRHGEWLALPHYRRTGVERVPNTPCRGGPVDEKEDRAP